MHKHLITLGFVGLYVALDAASFIHPLHGLNITPWNPAPALGLVFMLRRGARSWLPLLATVLLSEWLVRGIPQSWWSSLLSASILAGGYVDINNQPIIDRTVSASPRQFFSDSPDGTSLLKIDGAFVRELPDNRRDHDFVQAMVAIARACGAETVAEFVETPAHLELLRQMVDVNHGEGGRWAGMRIHLVRNDLATVLDSSSKMSAEWAFLEMLHKEGRRVAESFLAQDGANLGKRSSIDLNVLLEGV